MNNNERNDRQVMTARDIDRLSTVLVDAGVNVVKRNPIKVGGYVFGILLCLFFNGWQTSELQMSQYTQTLDGLSDYKLVEQTKREVDMAYREYYSVKGWFSCNAQCQVRKKYFDLASAELRDLQAKDSAVISAAKAKLGLFSEFGVDETRNLFWTRFGQGQSFATRQSKWDALFMGISAMGRDEKIASYLARVVMSAMFNFTLGVCGAVVAFIFGLRHVVTTYQAGLLQGLFFFALASLAAISFAMTWLIGLYAATAGTVYVGAKLLATNIRIEDGGAHQRRRL